MDPYGTFGAEPGITPQKQAIPTPSVKSGAVDQWQYSNPNPSQSRFAPVQDPSAKVTQYPGTATAPVDLTRLDSYYNPAWANIGDPEAPAPSVSQPSVYPSSQDQDQGSWRDRIYADRAASQNRSYSSGPSRPAQKTIQPMEAMKAPDLPEYKGIGEYRPPEEDKSIYAGARREAMGPGMRELREGTREAISSAQSLDNPNARAKFIQQSLKGYGQGLEKVAAGAAREGRTQARDKRQEQLSIYKTNYDIRSDTYLKNYQNQISTIAANFASEQAAQTANWNASQQPGVNVAGTTGGARDKSTYYGDENTKQPFMGYMN